MVFAANGGLVIEGRAYLARLAGAGLKDVTEPVHDPASTTSTRRWRARRERRRRPGRQLRDAATSPSAWTSASC
jgi:hypothetical protein